MLRCEDRLSPAIPRPFSVYRESGGELEFMIKVMGQGTRALAQSMPGTKLRVVGPLGNGCPVPTVPGGPMGSWPNSKCCVEGPVFSTRAITLCGAH
jgi:NAD(P)H-flavin reductase